MAQHAEYIDRMKDASVLETAARLGLEVVVKNGNQSSGSFPCPLCGAKTRHGEKGRGARGACGINHIDTGWNCFQCKARGDALGLVSAALFQKASIKSLRRDQQDEVRAWVQGDRAIDIPKRDASIPKPEPKYPSKSDVQKFLSACTRIELDDEVVSWMHANKIDPVMADARGWASALPASSGHHWAREGRRVIVPMRDVAGDTVSLKARGLVPGSKSHSPKTYSVSKLCFWDPSVSSPSRVIFVEGEKKFMQMSTLYPTARVIGIMNGSVTDEYAKLIPPHAEVWVLTDWNQAGADYATAIYNNALRAHDISKIRLRKGFVANKERRGYRIDLAQEP